MPIHTVIADLSRTEHQQAIVELIDMYSRDDMGDGKPLSDDVKQRLIPGLRAHPTTLAVLAFNGSQPIGIALCFRGFSSFQAKPLVNIHDLAVTPNHRGQGVGRLLLNAVADQARSMGCCKLTLETQERNPAQRLYMSVGFKRDVHLDAAGGAIFMTKPL
jgi:GNAT superfamily N-acetyltransferase